MTTTRETADHADHIGDATTMIDHAELARLAEAAMRVRRDAVGRLDGGDAVRIWGAFLDATTPAVCSALLSEIAALRGERDRLAEELHNEIMVCAGKSCDADVAERQRDELRKALETIGEMAPSTCETSLAHDMAQFASQALANQGADQ